MTPSQADNPNPPTQLTIIPPICCNIALCFWTVDHEDTTTTVESAKYLVTTSGETSPDPSFKASFKTAHGDINGESVHAVMDRVAGTAAVTVVVSSTEATGAEHGTPAGAEEGSV